MKYVKTIMKLSTVVTMGHIVSPFIAREKRALPATLMAIGSVGTGLYLGDKAGEYVEGLLGRVGKTLASQVKITKTEE